MGFATKSSGRSHAKSLDFKVLGQHHITKHILPNDQAAHYRPTCTVTVAEMDLQWTMCGPASGPAYVDVWLCPASGLAYLDVWLCSASGPAYAPTHLLRSWAEAGSQGVPLCDS